MNILQYTAFVNISEPEFDQFQYDFLNERILELGNKGAFPITYSGVMVGELLIETMSNIEDDLVKEKIKIVRNEYSFLENPTQNEFQS